MNLTTIEREDPSKQRQILSAMILQTFDTYTVTTKLFIAQLTLNLSGIEEKM